MTNADQYDEMAGKPAYKEISNLIWEGTYEQIRQRLNKLNISHLYRETDLMRIPAELHLRLARDTMEAAEKSSKSANTLSFVMVILTGMILLLTAALAFFGCVQYQVYLAGSAVSAATMPAP